jgi:hypothetical protein
VGVNSRIVSQNNVWLAPAAMPARRLVRGWGGTALDDSGSWLNGQAVDLLAALRQAHPEQSFQASVGWRPVRVAGLDPADAVAERVRRGAGSSPGLEPP